MKKILIASTIALFVGGWWLGAGGTYGSGEEAQEKAKEWEAKGRTWTVTKTKTRNETKRVIDPDYQMLLREYEAQLKKRSKISSEIIDGCKLLTFGQCAHEKGLKLPPIPIKPKKHKTINVNVVDKKQVKESTRKCRNQNFTYQDNFQMICKERPYKAKDWKGAKYVYFKVK